MVGGGSSLLRHFYEKGSLTMSPLHSASRDLLGEHQLARLQLGIQRLLSNNTFYAQKLLAGQEPLSLGSLDDLQRLPMTVKREFVEDQQKSPPFGGNLTYPLQNY